MSNELQSLTRRALLAIAGGTCLGGAAPLPVNTMGDRLGDDLDAGDFLAPAFSPSFATVPAFAHGTVKPSLPLPLTDPTFTWVAGYIHARRATSIPDYVPLHHPIPAFSWLSSELAVYPNADAIVAGEWSPFSIAPDGLVITADRPTPKMRGLIPAGFARDYISGAISSYPYSQTYGYFELRGRVPIGQGLWPAFWMLPVDMSWPPELDIMEVLGHRTRTVYTTVHSRTLPIGTMQGSGTNTADLSAGDHLYGMDWGPDRIRFYVDRRLVFSRPTPADCHKPFYLVANLAVGGPTSWPGTPDNTTRFPARFVIHSITAWQRASYLDGAAAR